MRVYLDNSATTPLDKEVLDAMLPYYMDNYGNPSSIHSHGREAKATIEKCRKTIANLLQTSPAEIFFTSGGTEGDNTALFASIETFSIQHVITSPLEHHAVLHSLEYLVKKGRIALHFVTTDQQGILDLNHFLSLLRKYPLALVSLMHANNEIGNLNDIVEIGKLMKGHNGIFHSDTVHAMGKYIYHLAETNIDFIVGAAHKFHGPQGSGFLYINHHTKVTPYIHGGVQEYNMRGGTENVAGIVGMTKALAIAYRDLDTNRKYITGLKNKMIQQLKDKIPNVNFNGRSSENTESLYSLLNVGLPTTNENDMLLFNLDINGVSVSGGSACASGATTKSHVLTALGVDPARGAIRFSFSKFNTEEEVDFAVDALVNLMKE